MKLSVLAAAMSDDPRAVPKLARQAGFRGVLFDVWSPQLDIPALGGTGGREFRHVLATQEQELVGLRMDLGAGGLSKGADVDRALHQLERAMNAAAELQAKMLCVDLGPLPVPPRQAKSRPRVSQEQAGLLILPSLAANPAPESTSLTEIPQQLDSVFASQVDGALAELGAKADRYGVIVAFRSELSPLSALQRALGQANCPWFGVDFDPVAVLRDDWSLDETFDALGPMIRHVRARDALAGSERRTQPTVIGQGNVAWNELLANLDAADFDGWMTVDSLDLTNRAQAAIAGRKALEKLAG
jgi:sugar phosphate isomerase/epimerase